MIDIFQTGSPTLDRVTDLSRILLMKYKGVFESFTYAKRGLKFKKKQIFRNKRKMFRK